MTELAITPILSATNMQTQIATLDDDRLDEFISLTDSAADSAAAGNKLGRIERGRRAEDLRGRNQYSKDVTPGVTSLSAGERKKRSQEKLVAEWVDDDPEERTPVAEEAGWKKLVAKASAAKKAAEKPVDKPVGHPAKFSEPLYAVFNEMLPGVGSVLDPFAGVGGVHRLSTSTRSTVGVEIEPEWAEQHPDTLTGDALELPFPNASFDAICTSPAYGNRMADKISKDDDSRRNYADNLGRDLSQGNAAAMQWGNEYREFHTEAWVEAARVLRPDGVLVLNVSDHVRDKKRVAVATFHIQTLTDLGFRIADIATVVTRRQKGVTNDGSRADAELVIKFQR